MAQSSYLPLSLLLQAEYAGLGIDGEKKCGFLGYRVSGMHPKN